MIPKIYIIILNYNGWADTIECLESVLRNDYPNYQVIVVDNNSPNNSMEYIKAWAEGKLDVWVNPKNPLRNLSFPPIKKPIPYVYYTKEEAEKGGNPELEKRLENDIPEGMTTRYPIVFIQTGENKGFSAGNNVGIRYALAKNDFDSIILLNNDTVISKNAILILMKAKEKYGNEAIYGGRIYYYGEPDKIWYDGGHFNAWLGRTTHINMKKTGVPEKQPHEVNFITFCYVLIPKEIIEELGLLDESYFMYVEDLDYSYRVWKNGYRLYHVSSSKIWHKVGASSENEISAFSAYWMMKNRVKFIKNHLPPFQKIISHAFIIISRAVKFPLFYLRGHNSIIRAQIKGYKDALCSME